MLCVSKLNVTLETGYIQFIPKDTRIKLKRLHLRTIL